MSCPSRWPPVSGSTAPRKYPCEAFAVEKIARAHSAGSAGGEIPWPTSLGVEGVHEDRDHVPGHGRKPLLSREIERRDGGVDPQLDVRSGARRHCDEVRIC
ncbi:hypothetical protein H5400_38960 [Rhodococcus wratislaviensis]|nr:hypothetical protein [Rhodococcus sp. 3A]MBC2898324.1 hypothetical protein [Rhodococcus sp. 4CII]